MLPTVDSWVNSDRVRLTGDGPTKQWISAMPSTIGVFAVDGVMVSEEQSALQFLGVISAEETYL